MMESPEAELGTAWEGPQNGSWPVSADMVEPSEWPEISLGPTSDLYLAEVASSPGKENPAPGPS